MVRCILIILIVFFSTTLWAQKIDAFATVSASKSEVYVEQGLKISVTAYSSTWFAQPLAFENLQIEGAFVQSFKRTQSGIKYVDNKKYASLEFYYIVFPYRSGEVVFPELSLNTSIPPEGDYKGQPVTLKTKTFTIKVKEIPDGIEEDQWMVANNVNISNSWSDKLDEIKLGEVVKREIIIDAQGTLPSFIDEAEISDLDFVSIYPHQPEFIDNRNNQSVNGKRIDSYSYLFEEEGTFTIPEVNIQWYHPVAQKLYKKTIPAFEVVVNPNPELASMQQLRDSLMALNPNLQTTAELEEEKSSQINTYIKAALLFLLVLLLGFYLVKWMKRIHLKQKKKKEMYLQSEAYHFKQMMKATNHKNLLLKIYYWLTLTPLPYDKKTLNEISKNNEVFGQESKKIKSEFFQSDSNQKVSSDQLKKKINSWREKQKNINKKQQKKYQLKDLNP
jgi:hypothetical protein